MSGSILLIWTLNMVFKLLFPTIAQINMIPDQMLLRQAMILLKMRTTETYQI